MVLLDVNGSSENILKTIKSKFDYFGFCLDDCIALVTDGCATMLKLGRLMRPVYHQICQQHLLQLVINDVVYDKKSTIIRDELEDLINIEQNCDALELDDYETEDSESDNTDVDEPPAKKKRTSRSIDDEIEDELANLLNKMDKTSLICEEPLSLNATFSDQIDIVRKIVHYFKKNIREDLLKKKTNNKCLLIDCKTRWSSLYDMLLRFKELLPSIKDIIEDLERTDLLNNLDESLINQMIETLGVFNYITKKLSSDNCNVLESMRLFDWAINDYLKDKNDILLINLKESLQKRLNENLERSLHLRVIKVLTDRTYVDFNEKQISEEIVRLAKLSTNSSNAELIVNENDVNLNNNNNNNLENQNLICNTNTNSISNLEQQFTQYVNSQLSKTPSYTTRQPNLAYVLKKDLKSFRKGNNLSKNLNLVLDNLKYIKATSVSVERLFSQCSYILNKYRNRMDNFTLNNIILLRFYLNMKVKPY